MNIGTSTAKYLRGGSWVNFARYCRSAYCGRHVRDERFVNLGFRCMRVAPLGGKKPNEWGKING